MGSDYGYWQGAAKATGDLNATGMQLLRYGAQREDAAANLALNKQRLEIEKQRASQETAKANLELEMATKKKEGYERTVDITTHPFYLSAPDADKPEILKYLSSNSITNEKGVGQAGKLAEGILMIGNTKELFEKFGGSRVEQAKQSTLAAWNELQEAKVNGDPKKIQAAEAKFSQFDMAYQSKIGNYTKRISELTKLEEARAKAGSANQSDEQLIARALRGDVEAQKILDVKQAREIEKAKTPQRQG
jgi:hypothetical protein